MGSYATLAALRERLGADAPNSGRDEQLNAMIDAAEKQIEAYTGRVFTDIGAGNETARVFATDDPWLVKVDDFHTTTNLAVKTDTGGDGTYDRTWTTSEYQLEPLNNLRAGITHPYTHVRAVDTPCFPASREARVQVTARWGWPAVPAAVKEATLLQAAFLWSRAKAPEGVFGFADAGIVRVSGNMPLDPTAAAMLDGLYSDVNRFLV